VNVRHKLVLGANQNLETKGGLKITLCLLNGTLVKYTPCHITRELANKLPVGFFNVAPKIMRYRTFGLENQVLDMFHGITPLYCATASAHPL
jgi:hypothetical protein